MKEAILYLIPVTIGDTACERSLPAYNRDIIMSLKHFIVEDLRTARRFLKKMEPSTVIDELHFVELNEHTPAGAVRDMLSPLSEGRSVGLMSEAGCPAVADPGAEAVSAAQREGYRVVPLVGPSSILMALMASGFNGQRFAFRGYLPVEAARRAEAVRRFETAIYAEDETQIFIETPYRNNRLLDDLIRLCRPTTRLCIAASITCDDEMIRTLPLREWARSKPDLNRRPALFLLYR